MKCSYCGNEIKVGSVYCGVCGREAQIVPDYNILEDDILTSILEDEKKQAKGAPGGQAQGETPEAGKGKKGRDRRIAKRNIAIAAGALAVCIVIGICLYLNSYGYHMKAGERADARQDYRTAVKHYQNAYQRRAAKPVDAAAALAKAGHDYYLLEDFDSAEDCLLRAIEADASHQDAYLELIQLYTQTGAYEKLKKLRANTKDSNILALFEQNIISPPMFSVEGGTFGDDVTLELRSVDGSDVYYTTNGGNPTAGSGMRYQEPIMLKDGTTTVRAACRDASGKFSRIVEQTYEVNYEQPPYPKVNPMSGTFDAPTKVTIEAEGEGSRIYYTWDGSVPTSASAEYTGPIDIPEGNNVLSILVIDKHGLCSDILKCNYKFMP